MDVLETIKGVDAEILRTEEGGYSVQTHKVFWIQKFPTRYRNQY